MGIYFPKSFQCPATAKNASQTKRVSVAKTMYHVLSIVNVEKHAQTIELNILT